MRGETIKKFCTFVCTVFFLTLLWHVW